MVSSIEYSPCLTDKVWEWYKTLSPSSVRLFDDFTELFLERYSHIKISRVTVESPLDMKQGPTEKIRAYVHRFTKVMRKNEN
jgi:Retrotransposon gag protein